jgi:hypothetical protein
VLTYYPLSSVEIYFPFSPVTSAQVTFVFPGLTMTDLDPGNTLTIVIGVDFRFGSDNRLGPVKHPMAAMLRQLLENISIRSPQSLRLISLVFLWPSPLRHSCQLPLAPQLPPALRHPPPFQLQALLERLISGSNE